MPNDPIFPIEVLFAPEFKRNIKRLKKRYPKIQDDVTPFTDQLSAGMLPGDQLQGIEDEEVAFKERLRNSDSARGQSGGYRIIYWVMNDETRILLTIYSKSDQPDISPQEVNRIIQEVKNSL